MEWTIEPGDRLRRRAVHELYGGQQQGGISTPRDSENIMIFTDPKAGAQFGYDRFEGLREDGTYGYTGAGQHGDQVFERGNKQILESRDQGKLIRLFFTQGPWVTYIGSFILADSPFRYEKVHDAIGELRQAIVFNLLPIEVDLSPLPEVQALGRELRMVDWMRLDDSDIVRGRVELNLGLAKRDEFGLQNRFAEWRRGEGHELKRLELPVGKTVLIPDFYDATVGEVVEAKKSAARGFVRLALGQSLDYAHNASRLGLEATPAVLLPSEPEPDLVELCGNHHVGLYVPTGSNFRNLTS